MRAGVVIVDPKSLENLKMLSSYVKPGAVYVLREASWNEGIGREVQSG
jgi:hypothetical protein